MHSEVRDSITLFFHQHGLTGARLVVAVSGGPDSVCLLHALAAERRALALDITVAHLNHCLRGAESELEQRYVKNLAAGFGLPCTTGQEDVKGYQLEQGLSLEEAARKVRYRFLAQSAASAGTRLIVTGHNRDDHIETILLHIIRGSGPDGLAGMKPLTTFKTAHGEITVARPLLTLERAQILEYCREAGLEPKTDSSNLCLSLLRNRVRLELLPLLSSYNPGVSEGLLRLSRLVSDDIEYLDNLVEVLKGDVITRQGAALEISRRALTTLHKAIQRRLLRHCIMELTGTLKDIENRHIGAMMSIVNGPAGRILCLPYGLVMLAGFDRCWLAAEGCLPCPYPLLDREYRLKVPGVTDIGGSRFQVETLECMPEGEVPPYCAYLDADAAGTDLTVRSRRRGDRFQPLGMAAEKKVARYMLDARLPRHWRAELPLVLSAGRVAWVTGQRIDERFKVTERTLKILKLEYFPAP